MPGKKHLPGATKGENEQYEAIRDKLQGEKNPRAKEIAARIVNSRKSGTKEEKSK